MGPVQYDKTGEHVYLDENKLSSLTVGQDAANTIERNLLRKDSSSDGIDTLSVLISETESELRTRLPKGVVDHFETETGFLVYGAVIIDVRSTNNAETWVLEKGDGLDQPAIIRAWNNTTSAFSLLVKLEDGRSAILAVLNGYIGHAEFDQDGLQNVSYIPSSNNWRWEMYSEKKDKIDRLRALISLSVEHNTFKIKSENAAESLAKKIRIEKSIDPTLGLYAAYAFNQASMDNHIVSVMDYMREDLGTDLYDVRVLLSRIEDKTNQSKTVVPFCPMLTQTWNLLRPRGIKLPDVLTEAELSLCNSLWTTFKPEATDRIIKAIERGELK